MAKVGIFEYKDWGTGSHSWGAIREDGVKMEITQMANNAWYVFFDDNGRWTQVKNGNYGADFTTLRKAVKWCMDNFKFV